ncbi:MAG: SipW-dependent-type signal peptide-containing protein, partial [bacterium]
MVGGATLAYFSRQESTNKQSFDAISISLASS